MAQVPIIINVRDINDNGPKFTEKPYYTLVNVSAVKGALVSKVTPSFLLPSSSRWYDSGSSNNLSNLQVVALDDDEGANSQVRFDLMNKEGSHFKISRKSGELTVKRAFSDSDANKEFELTVTAQDQGQY